MCVLALLVPTSLAAAPAAGQTVLSGYVRASSEDAQGKVLAVEIVVGEPPAEDPYLVLKGGSEAQLRALVGEWVVASGVVSEDKLGWKSIQVKSFTREQDLQEEEPMREPQATP